MEHAGVMVVVMNVCSVPRLWALFTTGVSGISDFLKFLPKTR